LEKKMSSPTPVTIILDDRLRLIGSALAATKFPEKAQERKRHHAHAHARAMIKHLQEKNLVQHPAIVALQNLLDQNTPIEAIFSLAMQLKWPNLDGENFPEWMPKDWNKQLWDFYEKAELASFWEGAGKSWDSAKAESQKIFTDKVFFKDLLSQFVGEIKEDFAFSPNILWPADRVVGVRVGNQLISLVPPPLAWGESPPWPFDEETRLGEHTYPAALSQYARLVLLQYMRANPEKVSEASEKEIPIADVLKVQYPSWEDQFVALFQSAVVAIYLEDYLSPTEAKGFLLMERKIRNMSELPGTVSVLRRFLQEKGNRYQSLAEFLPVFPTQLRVAKKIVTL
jgi:hypothetical protein